VTHTDAPRQDWTYAQIRAALSATRPDRVLVRVATSGSTGSPKVAMLTGAALTASAHGTHEVLGGAGQWLLATPTTHIAGIQVLVRSALADIPPVRMPAGGFSPAGFAAAAAGLSGPRRYTALVPTQVGLLLADDHGRDALASLDAVLVGGAAVPAGLPESAREAGVRLVATYGMSETAGGCVYDGVPLPVTRMRVAGPDDQGVGVVELSGATLALGYADRPALTAAAFRTEPDGSRWFRTDDLGRIDDGVLTVLGRRDDVINSGGLKVAPHLVEDAAARALPHLSGRCVVVATPHPRWGEAVTLVVVGLEPPDLGSLRATLRPLLPATALPTRVARIGRLPLLGPGKPDRRAVRALVAATLDR
jgi:o-succinylbenzoate---CoA ligase